MTGRIAAITAYFNSEGYSSKRLNYQRFRARLERQRVPLFTVEGIFADHASDLAEYTNVLRVRCRDVLWQKERLLNLALDQLPSHFTKVIWLDADVLFESSAWSADTADLLDHVELAQPFDLAVRLPRGHTFFRGEGEVWHSFAAVFRRMPNRLLEGHFDGHGHTGFAWAARRSVLKRGFYDACIAGSGDHAMAHAFCGDWESPCVQRIFGGNQEYLEHFRSWARSTFALTQSRLHCVKGTLCHLWHGEPAGRSYLGRLELLAAAKFAPGRDLKVGSDGCWEWSTADEELVESLRGYFAKRREDGDNATTRGEGGRPRSASAM